jgi:DNA-binding beta-propeller fold protein YncE
VIQVQSFESVGEYPTEHGSSATAVDLGTHTVYVANSAADNTVSVIQNR